MKREINNLLAHSGLLPESQSVELLAGKVPLLEDIITPLLIVQLDCDALTASDADSSWSERRIARQCLAIAFLLAVLAANRYDV